ncbi:hypothetical protein JCM10213_003134 [Rhodosporidiobolus nylandii]
MFAPSTQPVALQPLLRSLIPPSSPYQVPPPNGTVVPPATSHTPEHQRAKPLYQPSLCTFVRDLAPALIDQFDSFLASRLQELNTASSVPVELELDAALQTRAFNALTDFAESLDDYNEPSAGERFLLLCNGVKRVVHTIDEQLSLGDERRVNVGLEKVLPKHDTASNETRYKARHDIFLASFLPSEVEGEPKRVVPATMVELKTSDASRRGGRKQGGLFVRLQAEMERLGTFRLENLEHELRSLLEKAIVQAAVQRLPFFFFTDNVNFMIAVVRYSNVDDKFDVLLSDLHLVAPAPSDKLRVSFFTLLLLPFYPAHLSLSSLYESPIHLPAARLPTVTETRTRSRPREDDEEGSSAGDRPPGKKGRAAELHEPEAVANSWSLESYSAREFVFIYPDETAVRCKPLAPPSPTPSSSSSALPPLEPSGSNPASPSLVILTPPTPNRMLPHLPGTSAPSTSAPTLFLSHLVGVGAISRAWIGYQDGPAEQHPFVIKVSHSGGAFFLRREARVVLAERMENLRDCFVPAVGLFEADDRTVLLMEYGGEAAERWEDWTLDQRRVLFVALVRLHSKGVTHGDVEARNTAGVGSAVLPPRWLDFSCGTIGEHVCPGKGCEELEDALEALELSDERSKLAEMAATAGLVWQ